MIKNNSFTNDQPLINVGNECYQVENLEIIFSIFTKEEKKALEKIKREIVNTGSILETILKKENYFMYKRGFGNKTIKSISEIGKKIVAELTCAGFEEKLKQHQSFILRLKNNDNVSLEVLDKILSEDLESFMSSLSGQDTDILASRLEYRHKSTLEDLAKKYMVTRERIRQKEMKLKSEMFDCFRLSRKTMNEKLENYDIYNFNNTLPILSKSFVTSNAFANLINDYCDMILIKELEFLFNRRELVSIFAELESPISPETLKDSLESSFGISESNVRSYINKLELEGFLKKEKGIYSPLNLPNDIAVANVLIPFPEGLHWKTIVSLINEKMITETRLTRLTNFGSKYTYLYGRGIYRHKKYFINEQKPELLLTELKKYINEKATKKILLYNEYYLINQKKLNMNYYDFREIIKCYSEDYDLQFDGTSSNDVVGNLNRKKSKKISQKTFLLEYIRSKELPVRLEELTGLIKSKNAGHVHYYLESLINEKQVILIGESLYSTPGNVFKNEEVKLLKDEIKKLLFQMNKVLHIDFIRKTINSVLNYSYSKYYYKSFMDYYFSDGSVNRIGNLFFLGEKKYSNWLEMFDKYCKRDLPLSVNLSNLRTVCVLPENIEDRMYYIWKCNSSEPGTGKREQKEAFKIEDIFL